MSDDVFAGLPPTEPDRWLLSLGPFEDEQGKHFRLAIGCTFARSSWRARKKRLLAALGLRRAAERISLHVQIDIELFAVQPIHGDLVDRDGIPRADLFVASSPRVLDLQLNVTLGQGVQYYLLTLVTDAGRAEFPSFEAIVRWRYGLPDGGERSRPQHLTP
jgi:hypothetical protein